MAELLAAFEAGRGVLRLTGLVAATAPISAGPPRLTRPEVRAVSVRRAALLAACTRLQRHTSVVSPLQWQAAGHGCQVIVPHRSAALKPSIYCRQWPAADCAVARAAHHRPAAGPPLHVDRGVRAGRHGGAAALFCPPCRVSSTPLPIRC